MSSVATKEDWENDLIDGCEYLWTDWGAPMCGGGAHFCFLGRCNEDESLCPKGKKKRHPETREYKDIWGLI